MPIYEYKCEKCGKEFEILQKITDAPIASCEYCDGSAKRLVSLSAFHLKGGGWYVTDYGGKKPSSTTETKSTAPAAESAPAATTEPVAKPKESSGSAE